MVRTMTSSRLAECNSQCSTLFSVSLTPQNDVKLHCASRSMASTFFFFSVENSAIKKIRVDDMGTYIDEALVSMVTLPELKLNSHDLTTLRIGIKDSARYVGGINIFGKNSGDTEQDIIVQVGYKTQ